MLRVEGPLPLATTSTIGAQTLAIHGKRHKRLENDMPTKFSLRGCERIM